MVWEGWRREASPYPDQSPVSQRAGPLLLCRLFAGKAVRLQLRALASNSATSYARRATPEHIKDRLLTASRRNCIEIGANAVRAEFVQVVSRAGSSAG